MATAIARTDPRVRRTRELLTTAFADLMNERGFASVTVQDIAERAGINRATFYAHYDDKFALFDEMVRSVFRAELERRLPPADHFDLDGLPLLVRVVLETLVQIHEHCGPRDLTRTPPIEGLVQDEVQQYVRAWLDASAGARKRVSAATAALVVSSGIIGAGVAWSRIAKRAPVDRLVREICELLVPALN
ncbi:MAG: TetR/AcrR family transcriptional regulator [Chloroflexota bacterium]|nr:TetR/AcrR family transcriptional regulator [Chloroflexota bacterium]